MRLPAASRVRHLMDVPADMPARSVLLQLRRNTTPCLNIWDAIRRCTLTIETGKLARLAGGAVTVRYGDTLVLGTANRRTPGPGLDFFPLRSSSRSGCTPRARSPAASSSAKRARRRRPPWPPA